MAAPRALGEETRFALLSVGGSLATLFLLNLRHPRGHLPRRA